MTNRGKLLQRVYRATQHFKLLINLLIIFSWFRMQLPASLLGTPQRSILHWSFSSSCTVRSSSSINLIVPPARLTTTGLSFQTDLLSLSYSVFKMFYSPYLSNMLFIKKKNLNLLFYCVLSNARCPGVP